jgi:hypothetical protein
MSDCFVYSKFKAVLRFTPEHFRKDAKEKYVEYIFFKKIRSNPTYALFETNLI